MSAEGFQVVNNGARVTARFACTRCSAVVDYAVSGKLNPEMMAKRAERDGWRANPWRASGTLCPQCAARRYTNDPDSELKKVVPMAKPPVPTPAPTPTASAPAPAAATTLTVVRDPTSEQRSAIRGQLDKHFDEGLGAYAGDMNDQRIAELVGVPRVVVEKIREAAYGPLRMTPEVVALRNELASLRSELSALTETVAELNAKVKTSSSKLELFLKREAA